MKPIIYLSIYLKSEPRSNHVVFEPNLIVKYIKVFIKF